MIYLPPVPQVRQAVVFASRGALFVVVDGSAGADILHTEKGGLDPIACCSGAEVALEGRVRSICVESSWVAGKGKKNRKADGGGIGGVEADDGVEGGWRDWDKVDRCR